MIIEKILETVFIKDWNTIAHICEGGKIYIQLIQGKFFTKDQVRTELGLGTTEEFYTYIEDLFDEIHAYYKQLKK